MTPGHWMLLAVLVIVLLAAAPVVRDAAVRAWDWLAYRLAIGRRMRRYGRREK